MSLSKSSAEQPYTLYRKLLEQVQGSVERYVSRCNSTKVHESGHALLVAMYGKAFHDFYAGELPRSVLLPINIPSNVLKQCASVLDQLSDLLRDAETAFSISCGHVVAGHDDWFHPPYPVARENVDMYSLLMPLAGPSFQMHAFPDTKPLDTDHDIPYSVLKDLIPLTSIGEPDHHRIRFVITGLAQWLSQFIQSEQFFKSRHCLENFFTERSQIQRIKTHFLYRLGLLKSIFPLASPLSILSGLPADFLQASLEELSRRSSQELSERVYQRLAENGFDREALNRMRDDLESQAFEKLCVLIREASSVEDVE